jgi:hypothetical protein
MLTVDLDSTARFGPFLATVPDPEVTAANIGAEPLSCGNGCGNVPA